MTFPHLILLPGLHGTDELWPPLLAVIPPEIPRTIVSYPPDRVVSPAELLSLIEHSVPPEVPLAIIAESFSGPLAVEFAAAHPDRVRALALCATFIHPPWPAWTCRALAFVAHHFMRPIMYARGLLPDQIADVTVGRANRDALRIVRPAVVASRLRLVAETDCSDSLRSCGVPIFYLQAKRDIAVKPRSLREIQELCPAVQVKTLDCSHMILQRRPAEAWQAFATFLTESQAYSPIAPAQPPSAGRGLPVKSLRNGPPNSQA